MITSQPGQGQILRDSAC